MATHPEDEDITGPAHPEGETAAAASELAWLNPWLADQAEGATVNEILALLVETTLDPTLLTWDFLAGRLVVHPGDFLRYNRDQLDVRQDRGSWILRHRDDGRIPLRIRRASPEGWALIGPAIDDRALREAARRLARTAALAEQPWPMTVAAGIGSLGARPARLVGAELAALAEVTLDDELRCTRIEWSQGTFDHPERGRAAVDLVRKHTPLDLRSSLPRSDAGSVRVWLAQRGSTPVATIGFAIAAGHCSLGWIVSAAGADPAAALLRQALLEAAALEDAITTSAQVADRALADLLAGLGYRELSE